MIRALIKPFLFISVYAGWVILFRLLVLTLITYVLISSTPRLQDISEAFTANETLVVALSSVSFLAFMRLFFPLAHFPLSDIVTAAGITTRFVPGLLRGSVFASVVVGVFIGVGYFHYSGFSVGSDEPLLTIFGLIFRCSILVLMIYCEEYLFRRKLRTALESKLSPLLAVVWTSFFYCGVKALQFDLSGMQLCTLLLFSFFLTLKAHLENNFIWGAGFSVGLLSFFHLLFGLPIFGSDYSGIVIVKPILTPNSTINFLSGGTEGPLSSFALQFVLVLHSVRLIYKNKKDLFHNPTNR